MRFFAEIKMKVILLEGVKKLGQAGDVVEVKDGYAHNFLFRRKLAVPATDEKMNELQMKRAAKSHNEAQRLQAARDLARDLADKHLKMKVKTGSQGRLYGTVTTAQVAELLTAEGHVVDKRDVQFPETVKTVGSYAVTVKLHPEVTTKLFIDVESDEA